jgi:hypothetical protein
MQNARQSQPLAEGESDRLRMRELGLHSGREVAQGGHDAVEKVSES